MGNRTRSSWIVGGLLALVAAGWATYLFGPGKGTDFTADYGNVTFQCDLSSNGRRVINVVFISLEEPWSYDNRDGRFCIRNRAGKSAEITLERGRQYWIAGDGSVDQIKRPFSARQLRALMETQAVGHSFATFSELREHYNASKTKT